MIKKFLFFVFYAYIRRITKYANLSDALLDVMIPRAALAYIKWILPLTNEPVSTINISCAALTKEIPSVLQTQNKTDVHLPNLACIASLFDFLLILYSILYSPSFPPVSISFYTFNMPKNSKTVRRNPKKYA